MFRIILINANTKLNSVLMLFSNCYKLKRIKMKAEDLMIGNWVKRSPLCSTESRLEYVNCYVKTLLEDALIDNNGVICDYEDLEPIPLTEENIVELLGFEKLEVLIGYYFLNEYNCVVDFDIKQVRIGDSKCTLPKQVHKLQQLIKSLEE